MCARLYDDLQRFLTNYTWNVLFIVLKWLRAVSKS
jgi:hypothetical protein